MKASPSWATRSAPTPARTVMPSDSNVAASTVEASGSSSARMRSAASTTVTSTPKRAITWLSSQPMAPPPSTMIDAGSSVASMISWLVQKGVPASPSMGGTAAVVPVLTTMPLVAV